MDINNIKNYAIELYADGYNLDEVRERIRDKYPTYEEIAEITYNDPDDLKKIINRTNEKLGQTWGTMWRNIKTKAALGDYRSSKMLIEFIQNQSGGIPKSLKIIFNEDADQGDDNGI
jgi:hypothetical protein